VAAAAAVMITIMRAMIVIAVIEPAIKLQPAGSAARFPPDAFISN
jgi:hypothetical protein